MNRSMVFLAQEKIYFVKFIFRCIIEPNIFNVVEIDEQSLIGLAL